MDGLLAVGMFVLVGLGIAYLIFGIWCAKRRDSILEQCRGCLTKWNTYWYANFKILLYIACPLFFIGSLVIMIMSLIGVEGFKEIPVIQVAVVPLLCAGIFFFGLWRKKALEKKILAFGGEENLKLLKKMAFFAGLGTMFKFAFRFIHLTMVVVSLPAFNRTIRMEDGSFIQVMQNSDGTYLDRNGNSYRHKYGNMFERI